LKKSELMTELGYKPDFEVFVQAENGPDEDRLKVTLVAIDPIDKKIILLTETPR
jgi:hypothetical protein